MAKVIQFTGCSGAGKTTIANGLAKLLAELGLSTLIVDGDEFRKQYAADLGFSDDDRLENITRMAKFVNLNKSKYDLIIVSAINPFVATRNILKVHCGALLVYIKCSLSTLKERDTKGLYYKASLPNHHSQYLANLTGVNASFDEPNHNTLTIDTDLLTITAAINKIKENIF